MKTLAFLFLAFAAPLAVAQERMDLHLVLAFDVSASINDEEFGFQRGGTARALRSRAVGAAVEAAPGGMAIAVVQWSSVTRQALGLDWAVLRMREDARAYADALAAMPRRLPGGGTMIHSGLTFAEAMFATAPGTARRQVIDHSGNGRADDPERLARVRDRLAGRRITINGPAIEELNDDLTSYFHTRVIAGPHAFVITADTFKDVARAMQIKLYREISGAALSGLTVPALRPASCHRYHRPLLQSGG